MTAQPPFRAGHRARLELTACAAIGAALAAFALAPPSPAPAASAPETVFESFSTPPAPVRTVDPEYPEMARKLGIEGLVLCAVTIDAEGSVTAVEVIASESPMLDEAARRALLGWKFSPALQSGQPVASRVVVPVRFALDVAR